MPPKRTKKRKRGYIARDFMPSRKATTKTSVERIILNKGSVRVLQEEHILRPICEPSKAHERLDPPLSPNDMTNELESSAQCSPEQNHKTTSNLLHDLDDNIPLFLNALMTLYTPPPTQSCTNCSSQTPVYCCCDCAHNLPKCQDCIIQYHHSHPLHRITQFPIETRTKAQFAQSITLNDLGYIYYLGHGGQKCPNSIQQEIKQFTIIHCDGIRTLRILFCSCEHRRDQLSQMIMARLFPATTERPRTLFTHDVLDMFYYHTHESGATAYAFFRALKRMTNDTFYHSVEERYKEFLRVIRIWRHIQALLRSGQWLRPDDLLPDHCQNSLAVLCPACPQPGINMASDFSKSDQKYIHKFFAAIDGNFRQVLTRKRHDTNDYSLSEAQSYFVDSDKYNKYLQTVTDERELATCTGFKAGDIMRQNRDRNLIVTGVVAVSCARHNLVLPNSIVDLFKGEQYSSVDYAVASAIQPYISTTIPVELDYDIACKYNVNFEKRMRTHFPEIIPIFDRITHLVPSMHIKAHEERCQKQFTRDFFGETGKCDAEGSERIWSELNQWAPSASEMNPGHRHDVLNDNINDWNWRKLLGLAKYLVDRLILAQTETERFERAVQELSNSTNQTWLQRWKAMSTLPEKTADGKDVRSVYFTDTGKAPTYAAIRRAIREKQRQLESMPTVVPYPAQKRQLELLDVLHFGLQLEQLQENTRVFIQNHPVPSDAQAESLVSLRRTLVERLAKWRTYQVLHLPETATSHCDSIMEPEITSLNLPSTYSLAELQIYGLETAADFERSLRETMAQQSIKELKHELSLKVASLDTKQTNVSGQHQSTRAGQKINQHATRIKQCAMTYRRHYNSMVSLGMREGDTALKPLADSDCTVKNMHNFADPLRSNKETSWIWRMGRAGTSGNESEWEEETQRTQWFLTKAQKDRWTEEVAIVEEEMRRLIRYFRFFEELWIKLGGRYCDEPGKFSYTTGMAVKYRDLYEDALRRFEPDIMHK